MIYKSSNVGIAKIALSLSKEQQWHIYRQFGLGQTTGSGFPGEVSGYFDFYKNVTDFERATLSFGYGMSVTPLQLTRAYAAIANQGVINPVSFLKVSDVVVCFFGIKRYPGTVTPGSLLKIIFSKI